MSDEGRPMELDAELRELAETLRRRAIPVRAEVDQMLAAVGDLGRRLEALGESGRLDHLSGTVGDPIPALFEGLVHAADLVLCYCRLDWDAGRLRPMQRAVGELSDWITDALEHARERDDD